MALENTLAYTEVVNRVMSDCNVRRGLVVLWALGSVPCHSSLNKTVLASPQDLIVYASIDALQPASLFTWSGGLLPGRPKPANLLSDFHIDEETAPASLASRRGQRPFEIPGAIRKKPFIHEQVFPLSRLIPLRDVLVRATQGRVGLMHFDLSDVLEMAQRMLPGFTTDLLEGDIHAVTGQSIQRFFLQVSEQLFFPSHYFPEVRRNDGGLEIHLWPLRPDSWTWEPFFHGGIFSAEYEGSPLESAGQTLAFYAFKNKNALAARNFADIPRVARSGSRLAARLKILLECYNIKTLKDFSVLFERQVAAWEERRHAQDALLGNFLAEPYDAKTTLAERTAAAILRQDARLAHRYKAAENPRTVVLPYVELAGQLGGLADCMRYLIATHRSPLAYMIFLNEMVNFELRILSSLRYAGEAHHGSQDPHIDAALILGLLFDQVGLKGFDPLLELLEDSGAASLEPVALHALGFIESRYADLYWTDAEREERLLGKAA